MMLVGESGDAQPVCPRALDNARPIHLHRDIRLPDLFEWRIKISMLRAHLDLCLKFVRQTSVIDRDNISALQFRCDVVNPFEGRLIESPSVCRQLGRLRQGFGAQGSSRSLGARALHEHKVIAFHINKFFHVAADQAHRHRIQQFVGKMNAHEWLQRVEPLDLAAKPLQRPLLAFLQNWKWLDYSIAQSREQFWRAFLRRFENVAGELPIVRALFDYHEIVDLAESLPDFDKLSAEQLPKQRANADIGKIIARSSNRAATGGIISMFGMVERPVHEPGK